jgi:hypothetical protein
MNFTIETFLRDVQTIQKFKIIHVFGSSYEWKTYCWLYLSKFRLNFVRVGNSCECELYLTGPWSFLRYKRRRNLGFGVSYFNSHTFLYLLNPSRDVRYTGTFFNIEHSPYLFPMFSFKKHRSMHVCNHVTKVTKISTWQINKWSSCLKKKYT